MSKLRERIMLWIAWHLPRDLVGHCFVRVSVHACYGEHADEALPALNVGRALRRWNEG